MENTLAGVAGKKFILSYSCGKDSTLCLHKMLEAGAEPMALLVMFNPEAGRSYFHGAVSYTHLHRPLLHLIGGGVIGGVFRRGVGLGKGIEVHGLGLHQMCIRDRISAA